MRPVHNKRLKCNVTFYSPFADFFVTYIAKTNNYIGQATTLHLALNVVLHANSINLILIIGKLSLRCS